MRIESRSGHSGPPAIGAVCDACQGFQPVDLETALGKMPVQIRAVLNRLLDGMEGARIDLPGVYICADCDSSAEPVAHHRRITNGGPPDA